VACLGRLHVKAVRCVENVIVTPEVCIAGLVDHVWQPRRDLSLVTPHDARNECGQEPNFQFAILMIVHRHPVGSERSGSRR
jgi:hypothetical protein